MDQEAKARGRFRSTLRFLWRWAWALAIPLGIGAGLATASMIRKPEVDSLDRFQPGLITYIKDIHGSSFKNYATERRVMLREGEVPPLLQQAVVAVEDSNFFEHGGVDLKGVVRAARSNMKAGRIVEGASTLTMQLARELYLQRERSWRRKAEEALLAVEIEKRYSKQQILTLYCNLVNVGQGNYGMEAAARYYFDKSVADLTLAEAATLAGIPQRPSAHNPYRNPELVIERRNHVLARMLEEGNLSQEEYEAASAEPLLVVRRRREEEREPAAYFAEEVRRHLEDTYGANALYEGGLEVETTFDPMIQETTDSSLRTGLLNLDHGKGWRGPIYHLDEGLDLEEQALPSWTDEEPRMDQWHEGLVLASDRKTAQVRIGSQTFELTSRGIEWTRSSRPDRLLSAGDVAWFRIEPPGEDEEQPVLFLEQEPEVEGAAIVLESATGAVRAMVGGWDFRRSKFNRAVQARRQLGSAFKPFVYGAALEMGYTPADILFDGPVALPGDDPTVFSYSPRNYHRKYYGVITLRRALEASINVTSVKLLDLVGVERVVDFAQRMGLESDLPPYPSLALGSADVGLLELAAAYASIGNQGVYVEPYFVERVATAGGRVLEDHDPRARRACDPAVAFVLTNMLKGVVQRGTAASVRHLELDLAGKTGTTNNYTDAWFVGFSPRYTVLAWVGYDQRQSLGRRMTGARAALPVWRLIVEAGLEDGWLRTGDRFTVPAGVRFVPVDHRTGLLPPIHRGTLRPGSTPPLIIQEAFVAGTEPTLRYDQQWSEIIRLPWYEQRAFYIPKEGERMPEDVEDWDLIREAWSQKNKGPKARPEDSTNP